MYGRRTILFVDEIHRFNKSQQDYLLPVRGGMEPDPGVEAPPRKILILRGEWGASFPCPSYFGVKGPGKEGYPGAASPAVTDVEKGMGSYRAVLDEDAADFSGRCINGDARAGVKCPGTGCSDSTQELRTARSISILEVAPGVYPEAGSPL